jgi:sugar phosphate isomerase/epimerase
MIPCFSQVTTLTTPFEHDLSVLGVAGWRAVELWLPKLETYLESHSAAEARTLLADSGLAPLAASFQGGLLLSTGAAREAHWDLFRRRLAVLNELCVPLLVLVPDFLDEPNGDDLSRASDSLAEAAALAAPAGVRLALEFQRTARFCASLDTAAALAAHIGDNVSVCLDAFHYYTGPSKFEDLGLLGPNRLGLVQLCDLSGVPRELARDSDRIFPGEGDFQLDPILDQIAALGYTGPVSLEVPNPNFWSMPADRVVGFALAALERAIGGRGASQPAPDPAGGA